MSTSLTSPANPAPTGSTAITVIDLFAGVGGLSEGFHQADSRYTVVKAVEMEPRAAEGYRRNHGADVYNGRIEDWLRDEAVPAADLVIGGPPCQGFSALGAQRADDVRNELWRQYAEVVRQARPKYFVLENVPQFLSSPQFKLFEAMTEPGQALEDYAIRPHLVNAAQYGAAQVRKRVIVIGRRRDQPDPGFPDPTIADDASVPVKAVIHGLPVPGELPDRSVIVDGREMKGPFRAHEVHVDRNYSELSRRRFRAIPPGGSRMDLPEELKCEAWKKHRSGSGDVMGRLRWDKPSVTIRTEFIKPEKGRYLHPEEHRAITPYEGALLQGFPQDYVFVGPVTEIVKQIGNAVPIPLGKAIGEHLLPFFD